MPLPFKYKKVRLNDLSAEELENYCHHRLIFGTGCIDCPFYNDAENAGLDHRCIETIIYNNKKAQELIDKNIELEVADNG